MPAALLVPDDKITDGKATGVCTRRGNHRLLWGPRREHGLGRGLVAVLHGEAHGSLGNGGLGQLLRRRGRVAGDPRRRSRLLLDDDEDELELEDELLLDDVPPPAEAASARSNCSAKRAQ